jgi:Flp pilus assembly protein TadB
MAFWGLLLFLAFASIWWLTGTMERIPDQALALLGISGATGLGSIAISKNKSNKKESNTQIRKRKIEQELESLLEKKQFLPDNYTEEDEQHHIKLTAELHEVSRPDEQPASEGFWKDICNDGNGTSIHRLQVVFWTILLGVVFIKSVAQSMSIPEFPETLLLLIGISNGIYLGFKFPEKK